MRKVRCRMVTFDAEGVLLRDEFPEILKGEN